MITYSDYYEENLYKMQDGVLNIVESVKTPFYLTGGTAISRAYYNHRYSDDLDFFVNDDKNYNKYVKEILNKLKENNYTWDEKNGFIKDIDLNSVQLSHPNYKTKLKIDLVNDLPAHFGEINKHKIYNKIDNPRNILSNKLSAIFRYAAKDIIDIYEIAKHESFNWKEIFKETNEKDEGIEPTMVAEIITTMPESEYNSIKWKTTPDYETFKKETNKMAIEIIKLTNNTLNNKITFKQEQTTTKKTQQKNNKI